MASSGVAQKQQEYSDKSMYNGDWTDGQRTGRGTMTYGNGTRYTGQFSGGFHHGLGVMVVPDKSSKNAAHRYEGEFKNGCFHGFGAFVKSDGMKYEGEFANGNITGCGLMTFADGSNGIPRQEGKFDNGLLVEARQCSTEVKQAHNMAEKARKL